MLVLAIVWQLYPHGHGCTPATDLTPHTHTMTITLDHRTIGRMTDGYHPAFAFWSPMQLERYRQVLLADKRVRELPHVVPVRGRGRAFQKRWTTPSVPPPKNYLSSAKEYEDYLRRVVLVPFFDEAREKLAAAAGAGQAYSAITKKPPPSIKNLDPARVRMYFERLQNAHKQETIDSFRAALGVDVSRLLRVHGKLMTTYTIDNVRLIKSIPPRFHRRIATDLRTMLDTKAFDRQRLSAYFASSYGKSGYPLRRLARDQTTKIIGQLTGFRQREVGIQQYTWSTSRDDAVRPTHEANEGNDYAWNNPPILTGHPGHDIQCRCTAIPLITQPTAVEAVQASVPSFRSDGSGAAIRQRILAGSSPLREFLDLEVEHKRVAKLIDDLEAERAQVSMRPGVLQDELDQLDFLLAKAEKDQEAVSLSLRLAETEWTKASEAYRERVWDILGEEGEPLPLHIHRESFRRWGGTPSEQRWKKIETMAEHFGRIVRGGGARSRIDIDVRVTNTTRSSAGDMYKEGGRPLVTLSGKLLDQKRGYITLAHEAGHALEDQDRELFLDAVGFLYGRTTNKKLTHLGRGYRANEVARDGGFVDPYIGKEYATGEAGVVRRHYTTVVSPWQGAAKEGDYIYATEVVSMGLGEMLRDPVGLARKDPEYFDFIYEKVLRRYLPAATEKTEADAARAVREIIESVPDDPDNKSRLASFAKFRWGDQVAERVRGDVFDSMDGPVLLRGIANEDLVTENLNGTWLGTGVYGNGNYYAGTGRTQKVLDYAFSADENAGWVYATKLKPDAKIISYADLQKEYASVRRHWGREIGFDVVEWDEFFLSEGEYAAYKGFDAIHIAHEDYYVILNQRKLAVDERMLPGGTWDTRDYVPADLRRLKTTTAREYEREIDNMWDGIQQLRARNPGDEDIPMLEGELTNLQNKVDNAMENIEKKIEVEIEKTRLHLRTQVEEYASQ